MNQEISDPSHRLITADHRAIHLAGDANAKLYDMAVFEKCACRISPARWSATVIPSLRHSASAAISLRLTAAAARARKHAPNYGVSRPGDPEIATEVLFDSNFCRPNEKHLSRHAVHQLLRKLQDEGQPLRLGLPLFSRKPVSPIKSRGGDPDLAEMASLLRCYTLAKMLSYVHEPGVLFDIYADGHKYRRACGTPIDNVRSYQDGLRYWCKQLGIADLVHIVDYERAVNDALGAKATMQREERYTALYSSLNERFGPLFLVGRLSESLEQVGSTSPIGWQIVEIFRSIASSVYYQSDALGERLARGEADAQEVYLDYISQLHGTRLRQSGAQNPSQQRLMLDLCAESWDAALRYMAISLTDREADIWSWLNPHGIKLTIHGKPGEIQFRPTSSEFMSMTAQHCVGGLKPTLQGAMVTYAYRLARESRGEVPVLLAAPPSSDIPVDVTLARLIASRQPICYVDAGDKDPYRVLQEGISIHD